jgi:hypothetical protein
MEPVSVIVFLSYSTIIVGVAISSYYMSKRIGKTIYDELHETLHL